MGRKRHDAQFRRQVGAVHERVIAALHCANVMRPDLDATAKRMLVNAILTLGDGQDRTPPRKQITDAQIVGMVWRHIQCIHTRCPLLVFGRQLADELNAYFDEE